MPAASSYPGGRTGAKYNGGEVSEGNMPAIQMEKADHEKTISHGWEGNVGKSYRSMQNKLIQAGMLEEAIMMDIVDIKTQFGNKYDKAIAEMMAYAKCMKFI